MLALVCFHCYACQRCTFIVFMKMTERHFPFLINRKTLVETPSQQGPCVKGVGFNFHITWMIILLIAKRRYEVHLRNFQSNLTSTPWGKRRNINFPFLSNRFVFDSFCYWFLIKFSKRYLVSGIIASNY